MTLFLPLLLIAPVMMLIVAVLALASHGPLGFLAAGALLLGVGWACTQCVRLSRRWWTGTKAPALLPGERGPWAGPPRGRPGPR